MWIVRELARLLARIAVAVAVATLIAGLKAVAAGGGMMHTWRITLFALAGLMLLLAAAGHGPANRRVDQSVDTFSIFPLRIPHLDAKPEEPALTRSAVFLGSGIALVALGFVV